MSTTIPNPTPLPDEQESPPASANRSEQHGRAERTDLAGQSGRAEQSGHPEQSGRPEQSGHAGHEDRSGYWYADHPADEISGVDVLNALRRYRSAEVEMRRRTRDSMGMGDTDLLALRLLLRAQQQGNSLSPRDLARALSISSASTTVLIDRLVKSGHVQRQPHPTDRRSIVVVATPGSDDEVRDTLGAMHRRMIEIVDGMDHDESVVVVRFLEAMRGAVSQIDPHGVTGDAADR